jgi:hypothetical protein
MSHPNRGRMRKACVNPSVDEIRRVQARAGLTNARAAELVCVAEHTWENWVTEGPNNRQMPAGAWKLFRYEVGLLDPPKTRS